MQFACLISYGISLAFEVGVFARFALSNSFVEALRHILKLRYRRANNLHQGKWCELDEAGLCLHHRCVLSVAQEANLYFVITFDVPLVKELVEE